MPASFSFLIVAGPTPLILDILAFRAAFGVLFFVVAFGAVAFLTGAFLVLGFAIVFDFWAIFGAAFLEAAFTAFLGAGFGCSIPVYLIQIEIYSSLYHEVYLNLP